MKFKILLTFFVNAILIFFNIIAGIITARSLGPEGKGILRIMVVWTALFSSLSLFGLNEAYVYFHTRFEQKTLKFSLYFLTIVIELLAGFFLYFFFKIYRGLELDIYLPVFYMLGSGINYLGLGILQAELKFIEYNLIRIILPLSYLLLLVIYRHSLTPLKCYTFLMISNLATSLYLFLRTFPLTYSLLGLTEIKKILSFGFKVQIFNLFNSLSLQLDQLLLSLLIPPALLGIYSVSSSIGRIAFLMPNAFQIVLYPVFVKTQNRVGKKIIVAGLISILILWIVLLIVIKPLVLFFYGKAFEKASSVAVILFLAGLPYLIIQVLNAEFKAQGKPVYSSFMQGIVLISLIILLPVGYKLMALEGVAAGFVLSYLIGAGYGYFLKLRRL